MRSETQKWNGVKLGIGRLCGLKGRVIGSCCWLARSCLLACQPTTDGLLASSNTEQQPLPRDCQLPNCPMENPRPLLRQGTSSQYQNSYLDLAVWYSICQLNKNISKYWDGNAIYCQLLQPTNVNTTLCHRTDWDPLLCGCLSPDKVDLGFMKLALFPSRTLFQPSKNNRNSRWTNTLIRHQFSWNALPLPVISQYTNPNVIPFQIHNC